MLKGVSLTAHEGDVIAMLGSSGSGKSTFLRCINPLDPTGVARIIVARSFAVYEIYITAGILYLMVTYAMLYGFRKPEHWWSGHMREPPDDAEQIVAEAIQMR